MSGDDSVAGGVHRNPGHLNQTPPNGRQSGIYSAKWEIRANARLISARGQHDGTISPLLLGVVQRMVGTGEQGVEIGI